MSKRRWFQIHLSTAILLMFVAGGLIWANIAERKETHQITSPSETTFDVEFSAFGWPYNYKQDIGEIDSNATNEMVKLMLQKDSWGILTENILISAGILAMVLLFCEFLIRRRENRVAPPPQTSNT